MFDVKEKFPKVGFWFSGVEVAGLDLSELKKSNPKIYEKLMGIVTKNHSVTVGFDEEMFPVCYMINVPE